MTLLKPAARRVQEAADAAGLDVRVRHMPQSTRTADEAATACGCSVGEIVKSLVFKGRDTGRPYLLLVSGANRVDEKCVAASLGERLTRPDADFVRDATGFAIGGIPPIGHLHAIATFIDRDLLRFETVWAAAGTPDALFAVPPKKLAEATAATVIDVTPAPRR
jgi:prolyl-tRNA editing enzyme YbaK/EbsC (Cys-tRNA(Pro) deacylase)